MNQKTYRTQTLPFDKLTPAEQISEIGYKRLLELVKAAYHAINRAYPAELRKSTPKLEYRYQEAQKQAKQHLNFYKVNIRDVIVEFAVLTRHKTEYDASQDQSTQDFRKLVVAQFDMLKDRLADYAPIMVPEEDVPSFLSALELVYERERINLLEGEPPIGISHYEAAPRYTAEDFGAE
jgi:hypothetical protein